MTYFKEQDSEVAHAANTQDRAVHPPWDAQNRSVMILYSDDSTLFFALRMREALHKAHPDLTVQMTWYSAENALSYRQMKELLPEGPDRVLGKEHLDCILGSTGLAAIITSRVYRPLADALKKPLNKLAAQRPCVVAFLGGLDFFPENGQERRRNCDGIFLFPKAEITAYETRARQWDIMWQEVGFGHPTFIEPKKLLDEDLNARRDIYFFAQALSPSTKRGRLHMMRAMAAIARANPDYTVWIKLRHLPDENKDHLHTEKHDYPSLLEQMQDKPANLKTTACTMEDALSTAALGITCTSTAAADLIRAGVPCMVNLDYVDNYLDPLVEPMRKMFSGSGLIVSLEDMLHLRIPTANPDWIAEMFCPDDLGTRVLDVINRFEKRSYRIPPAG